MSFCGLDRSSALLAARAARAEFTELTDVAEVLVAAELISNWLAVARDDDIVATWDDAEVTMAGFMPCCCAAAMAALYAAASSNSLSIFRLRPLRFFAINSLS